MKIKKMGVCAGRHDIPGIEGYIFDKIENVTDIQALDKIVLEKLQDIEEGTELHIYVTGLTVATIAIVNFCIYNSIPLTLWHFNNVTNKYFPQEVVERPRWTYYEL